MGLRISLALALSTISGLAAAQDPASGAPPTASLPTVDAQLVSFAPWLRSPVVKGKPFCAEATQETATALQDGNRIVRNVKSRVCRDADGRMRQELERNGQVLVYLNDAVDRKAWLLNPQRQVAQFVVLDEALRELQTADRIRLWARRLVGQEPQAPVRVASGAEPVTIGRAPEGAIDVQRTTEEALGSAPPFVSMQAGVQWQERMAQSGPAVLTSLGQKEIEGVRANGRMATWTIRAGAVGNEKPIVMTAEAWFSPELEITLLTRHADPRSGVSTFKISNLDRRVPSASLFAVPAGYVIRQRPIR
jgi:hypothetical protein